MTFMAIMLRLLSFMIENQTKLTRNNDAGNEADIKHRNFTKAASLLLCLAVSRITR